MIHPYQKQRISEITFPGMTTTFFNRCYEEAGKVMGSFDSRAVWSERRNGIRELFVGFVQIFSEKTLTTLKITELVAYPVHAMLLNVSRRKSHWVTDNGHTLVGFLLVCCSGDEVEEKVSSEGNNISV